MNSRHPMGQFSEYQLAGQQNLIQELMHDRHRDLRNLPLINDLIDARTYIDNRQMGTPHCCGCNMLNCSFNCNCGCRPLNFDPSHSDTNVLACDPDFYGNTNSSAPNMLTCETNNYGPLTNRGTNRTCYLPLFQQSMATKCHQIYPQPGLNRAYDNSSLCSVW